MAGKNPSDAELDSDIQAEARSILLERRRRATFAKQPWWVCSSCAFENHPRGTHPGHTKCEQCGKERDDGDITRDGPRA